jgi:hypothetical protein
MLAQSQVFPLGINGNLRWETVGEGFFYFFQKNNNDNLRWRTIGVSPITTGKRLFAVRLDVCRALYFGRMTKVCLTFIFYRAHGKGLVCRASCRGQP